jgi:hypothetical protein
MEPITDCINPECGVCHICNRDHKTSECKENMEHLKSFKHKPLTVAELIKLLEGMPQDLEVAYPKDQDYERIERVFINWDEDDNKIVELI